MLLWESLLVSFQIHRRRAETLFVIAIVFIGNRVHWNVKPIDNRPEQKNEKERSESNRHRSAAVPNFSVFDFYLTLQLQLTFVTCACFLFLLLSRIIWPLFDVIWYILTCLIEYF